MQMPFKILMDHLPLIFMRNQEISNTRVLRWLLFLQSFNCSLVYIKGKKNSLADFLSRDLLDIEESKEVSCIMLVNQEFWKQRRWHDIWRAEDALEEH